MLRTLKETSAIYLEPIRQLVQPNYRYGLISAKVVGKKQQSSDIWSYTLRPAKPLLSSFRAGQHTSLNLQINGKYVKRYFSLSSPPGQLNQRGTIEISTKINPNGVLTKWTAQHLEVGSYVNMTKPAGTFYLNEDIDNDNVAFVAAGSGITPLLSMLEHIVYVKGTVTGKTLLFYLNNPSDTPFSDRLDKLTQKGLKLRIVDSRTEGRISLEHIIDTFGNSAIAEIYSCGPQDFSSKVEHYVKTWALNKKLVAPAFFKESFGVYIPPKPSNSKIDNSFTSTWLSHSGSKHLIESNTNDTLLNSAEKEGLTPLYGCRAGICHQCTCKKVSGQVLNLLTGELSSYGEEQIQLCISAAQSDLELVYKERQA